MIPIEKLSIIFFGTPEFAVESLSAIIDAGCNVKAVVTMPDKPAGRGHRMFQSPVKEFALSRGIELLQPVKLKDEAFLERLRELDADLFVVIAFRMLPAAVWQMPRLGTFNLHASLLPRYRGAAPINWAIINGDDRTGVTTFFLRQEIDTGDIIDREAVEILPDDNVGTLHDRLMHLGAKLTLRTIRAICDGTLRTLPQSAITDEQPTPAPKIFKDTCRIDWTMPPMRIHNLVRGLSPYPAAWTELHAEGCDPLQLKIFTTAILPDSGEALEPGSITTNAGGNMTVACGDGHGRLQIIDVQAQGKRRMGAPEFIRGLRADSPRLV